jgi:hypothetical protein
VAIDAARPSANTRAPAAKKTVALDRQSQRLAAIDVAERARPRRPVAHAALAAERAVRRNSLQVQLPIIGEFELPAAEEVAFIGGVTALAIAGVLEWPVAVLLGVGHGMAAARHNKLLRSFGQALEEA